MIKFVDREVWILVQRGLGYQWRLEYVGTLTREPDRHVREFARTEYYAGVRWTCTVPDYHGDPWDSMINMFNNGGHTSNYFMKGAP